MKKLILLAFVIIANVFAGKLQEKLCGDKSLLHCINHFDRQCKAKNYGACFFVGGLYMTEQEQYGKAKKYYEMVCDKANNKDTFQLELIDGSMGNKVPVIIAMQGSCYSLGILYRKGWGVKQSYEKALQYWEKACDLGSGESCGDVGREYYYGEGVKKDLKTAIKFYTKSCELEDGYGCFVLGTFYEGGEGVKQNISKAKELYDKSCDLRNLYGCDSYESLIKKGY